VFANFTVQRECGDPRKNGTNDYVCWHWLDGE